MKVALVGPVYPLRGGIAHYTALLAHELGQIHDTRVYSFARLYPQWLFPGRSQLDASPSPILPVQARSWLVPWLPHTWRKVARDWADWQPDLIVTQWWVPFLGPTTAWLARSARGRQAPVVAICHNVLPHERQWFDRPLVRLGLSLVDCLVVHSAAERKVAQALFQARRIELATLPRQGRLVPETLSRGQARAKLALDGQLVLFFGFVRPYKGLLDLLAAMPDVVRECDVRLVVVGEVWGSPEPYTALVKGLGLESRVSFVNRYVTNEEAAAYLAAADLVVLPYRHSTGSAATQLAYAYGVPVVATRTGSLVEAVEDGVTGFLVEPGDVPGLAAAITRFFREDRAAAFREAIARQHDAFGWRDLIGLLEACAVSQASAAHTG